MSEDRSLLLLARLGREERMALMAEAAAAAYELNPVDTLEAAALALAAHPPPAVLVELALPEAERLCRKVRAKRRAVDVAIFGLANPVTDVHFASALRWGVDDVISPLVEGALATRLVALPLDPTMPVADRGDAVVATRDETGNLIGRLLTNAGYDVEYAGNATSLLHLAGNPRIRLVVAATDLGAPREHIEATRRRGANATWIVLAPQAELAVVDRAVEGLPRVGVVSLADAFDHILFVSNDLATGAGRAERRERRIPYGALCAFQGLGRTIVEHGFTYNVSPSGLYVRTLSPPREDEVALELLAPGTDRTVRLEGTVAWRRGFGRLGTATAPPGFGVRITGGNADDRTAWARACTALLANRAAPAKPRGSRSTPPVADTAPVAAPAEPVVAASPSAASADPPIAARPPAPAPSPLAAPEPRPRAEGHPAPAAGGLPPAATAAVPKRTLLGMAPIDAATPDDEAAAAASAPHPKTDMTLRGDVTRRTQPGPASPDAVETVDRDLAGLTTTAPTGGERAPTPTAPAATAIEAASPTGASPNDAAAPAATELAASRSARREPDLAASAPRPHPRGEPTDSDAKRPPRAASAALGREGRGAARDGGRPAATAPPAEPPRAGGSTRPRSVLLGLVLGVLAVIVTVALVLTVGRSPTPKTAQPPPSTAPAVPPAPVASRSVVPVAARSTAVAAPDLPSASGSAPTELAVSEEAPSAAPEEAPSAAPPPSASSAPPEPTAPAVHYEPAEGLLALEGLLLVEADTETEVFSNGVQLGPTGQSHKIRCGLRFVRLGDEPGKWRSEGMTVDIHCGELTRVRIPVAAR